MYVCVYALYAFRNRRRDPDQTRRGAPYLKQKVCVSVLFIDSVIQIEFKLSCKQDLFGSGFFKDLIGLFGLFIFTNI